MKEEKKEGTWKGKGPAVQFRSLGHQPGSLVYSHYVSVTSVPPSPKSPPVAAGHILLPFSSPSGTLTKPWHQTLRSVLLRKTENTRNKPRGTDNLRRGEARRGMPQGGGDCCRPAAPTPAPTHSSTTLVHLLWINSSRLPYRKVKPWSWSCENIL